MALTYTPLAEDPRLDQLAETLSHNVSEPERTCSILGGLVLVALGASRRSAGGALVALFGAALLHRGVSGHCRLYSALGIHSGAQNTEAGVANDRGRKVVETITIQKPRADLFQHWRQLDNLPHFMPHLEQVEVIDATRSRWVARALGGQTVEWQAEIINERADELIAWQSLPGADVPNAGSVWFEDESDGGTRVKVALEYEPPAGALGEVVSRLFGEAPQQQLRNDLERWKTLMEKPAHADQSKVGATPYSSSEPS
jgi:uncharacterized membrane protein